VLNNRHIKSVVAAWVAAAIAILSFGPPEHLHSASTSGSGHPVKHWHHIDDYSGSVGASVGHGNHVAARLLEAVFKTGAKYTVDPPAITPGIRLAQPDWRLLGHVQAVIFPIIHGPPHLPSPSRAPPLPVSPI